MPYFHVTEARLMQAIQQQGLQPQLGPRSRACCEPRPAVFCFSARLACENALLNWLGEAFEANTALVILELDISPERCCPSDVLYEVVFLDPIAPAHITRVWTEEEFA